VRSGLAAGFSLAHKQVSLSRFRSVSYRGIRVFKSIPSSASEKFFVGRVLRTITPVERRARTPALPNFSFFTGGHRPMRDCLERFLVAPASCRCGSQAGSLCHQRRRARRPAPPTFHALPISQRLMSNCLRPGRSLFEASTFSPFPLFPFVFARPGFRPSSPARSSCLWTGAWGRVAASRTSPGRSCRG
jgi:hypothetical protein